VPLALFEFSPRSLGVVIDMQCITKVKFIIR
jgi:hypothetical protein